VEQADFAKRLRYSSHCRSASRAAAAAHSRRLLLCRPPVLRGPNRALPTLATARIRTKTRIRRILEGPRFLLRTVPVPLGLLQPPPPAV